MPNTILSKVKTIAISAGHGGKDPGAVFGGFKEKDETVVIAKKIVANLKAQNINAEYIDRDQIIKDSGDSDLLVKKINFVNKTYKDTDWVIDIHRDSASGLGSEQANKQMGVYFYGGDSNSQAIAEEMVKTFKDNGAFRTSWARPDTVSRFGRLGWIRDTKPVAHLIECGFMQGEHTPERINWYAELATEAIYRAFTGNDYNPKPIEEPETTPVSIEELPQYPREEVRIEDRIPNFNDLPEAYKNAIRNDDEGWLVNSLTDRDLEVTVLKNQVQELKDKNSVKTQELAEKDSEIQDLKTQLDNSNSDRNNLQLQIDNLNKELIEKNKIIDKAQTDSTNIQVQNLETKLEADKEEKSKLEQITGIKPETAIEFIKERLSKLVSTRFLTMAAGTSFATSQMGTNTNLSIASIAGLIISYIASETVLKAKK
jgi:N-acetylmuramoyl-L-alanine amidase/predicted  nucleic acid-binding Zn-ribbon protein